MHIRKKQNVLMVMQAVDDLSFLAQLDEGKRKREPSEFAEEMPTEQICGRAWSSAYDLNLNLQRARETFTLLFNYLKNLYENQESQLRDLATQKSIQALILISMEAAQNLEKYLDGLSSGNSFEKVREWQEYKQLQQFYLNVIAPKMQNQLERFEGWQEEWAVGSEEEEFLAHRGIQDIQSIRQDRDYELFLISREGGSVFFTRSILRHIHLVEQFDQLIVNDFEEDALNQISFIQDKNAQLCAKSMLEFSSTYIDDFYRMGMKYKDMHLIATMNKALFALMLASNPRNLMYTALEKSCKDYFADYLFFIRTLLTSKEYQKSIDTPPPASERLVYCLFNLSEALSIALFTHESLVEEMGLLIGLLVQKGLEVQTVELPSRSPLSMWNTLLDQDELVRNALKFSPYGPLHNAVVLFNEKQQLKGFDPLIQTNAPYFLYTIQCDQMQIDCLHIPSPTLQNEIKKAEIIPEFHLFLRALSAGKRNQRHFLINLQDRTSWQEYARCVALEELGRKHPALSMITLATDTDFYRQSDIYAQLDDAEQFIKAFCLQLEDAQECGFYFPQNMQEQPWSIFIQEAMRMIHEVFFSNKAVLVHKNRLDFIEIFYLLFLLKWIEEIKPDTLSFTSKDAIDSAAAWDAKLFCLLKMGNSTQPWSEAEKQFISWLFYAPALLVRNRAIESQHIKRAISALSLINAQLEAHYQHVIDSFNRLFRTPFFRSTRIIGPKLIN